MNDVTSALCTLFSRLADNRHPFLKEPPLKGHVHKDTGVATFTRDDLPHITMFSFITPICPGERWEDAKLMRIQFDFQQLEAHGEEYILGTVQQAQKAINLFTEHAREQHKDDKIVTLH